MKKTLLWLPLLVAALLLAACAGQKGPATQAVAQVEAALNAVRPDATKYAPDELQQVDAAVTALKDSLAKKDYKSVVANAPAVQSQVSGLQQTVATKKTEMESAVAAATEQWQKLAADVPQMVEAIQSRVDTLSKSRKLPKNVSADALQMAKDGLESMKIAWAEATTMFGSGNAVDAVTKAQAVQEKGKEVMQLLGMNA
jgi:predicted small lipoprotein YifL